MGKNIFKAVAALLAVLISGEALASGAPSISPNTPLTLVEITREPLRLSLPGEHALLKEAFAGTNGKLIIQIEDPHANLSGQEHLAGTLDWLQSHYRLPLVLVEGGVSDCSLDALKGLAPAPEVARAAKSLFLKGQLTGEEYLNLTSERPMQLWGVEDMKLYFGAAEDFARLRGNGSRAAVQLEATQRALEQVKTAAYPRALLVYEGLKRDSEKGIGDAARYLMGMAEAKDVATGGFETLTLFMGLLKKEKAIHFEAATLELFSLSEKTGLEPPAAAKRQGSLAALRDTLEQARLKGFSPAAYPNVSAYYEYLSDFSAFDAARFHGEMNALEAQMYGAYLQKNDGAKALRAMDAYLQALKMGLEARMASADFVLFQRERGVFEIDGMSAFLNSRLAESGNYEQLLPYDKDLGAALPAIEDFYVSVSKRDEAFVRNAEKELSAKGEPAAVLIAGGYHTEQLTRLFRQRGYSVAVVTPRVTSETDRKKYEKKIFSLGRKQRPVQGTAVTAVHGKPEKETLRPLPAALDARHPVENLFAAQLSHPDAKALAAARLTFEARRTAVFGPTAPDSGARLADNHTMNPDATLEELIRALNHYDAGIRASAAQHLGDRGPAATQAIGFLKRARQDWYPPVREATEEALKKIGRDSRVPQAQVEIPDLSQFRHIEKPSELQEGGFLMYSPDPRRHLPGVDTDEDRIYQIDYLYPHLEQAEGRFVSGEPSYDPSGEPLLDLFEAFWSVKGSYKYAPPQKPLVRNPLAAAVHVVSRFFREIYWNWKIKGQFGRADRFLPGRRVVIDRQEGIVLRANPLFLSVLILPRGGVSPDSWSWTPRRAQYKRYLFPFLTAGYVRTTNQWPQLYGSKEGHGYGLGQFVEVRPEGKKTWVKGVVFRINSDDLEVVTFKRSERNRGFQNHHVRVSYLNRIVPAGNDGMKREHEEKTAARRLEREKQVLSKHIGDYEKTFKASQPFLADMSKKASGLKNLRELHLFKQEMVRWLRGTMIRDGVSPHRWFKVYDSGELFTLNGVTFYSHFDQRRLGGFNPFKRRWDILPRARTYFELRSIFEQNYGSRLAAKDEIAQRLKESRVQVGLHTVTGGKGFAWARPAQLRRVAGELSRRRFIPAFDDETALFEVRPFFVGKDVTVARRAVDKGANLLFISDDFPDDVRQELKARGVFLSVELSSDRSDLRQAISAQINNRHADGILIKPYRKFEQTEWRQKISLQALREIAEGNADTIFFIAGGVFEDQVRDILSLPLNVVAAVGFDAKDEAGAAAQAERYALKLDGLPASHFASGSRLADRQKISRVIAGLRRLYKEEGEAHEKSHEADKRLRKLSVDELNALAARVFKTEIEADEPLEDTDGLKGDVYRVILALYLQQQLGAPEPQGEFSDAVKGLLEGTSDFEAEKKKIAFAALPLELKRIIISYHQAAVEKEKPYTLGVAVREGLGAPSTFAEAVVFPPTESGVEASARIDAVIGKVIREIRASASYSSAGRYEIVGDYDELDDTNYSLFVQKAEGVRLARDRENTVAVLTLKLHLSDEQLEKFRFNLSAFRHNALKAEPITQGNLTEALSTFLRRVVDQNIQKTEDLEPALISADVLQRLGPRLPAAFHLGENRSYLLGIARMIFFDGDGKLRDAHDRKAIIDSLFAGARLSELTLPVLRRQKGALFDAWQAPGAVAPAIDITVLKARKGVRIVDYIYDHMVGMGFKGDESYAKYHAKLRPAADKRQSELLTQFLYSRRGLVLRDVLASVGIKKVEIDVVAPLTGDEYYNYGFSAHMVLKKGETLYVGIPGGTIKNKDLEATYWLVKTVESVLSRYSDLFLIRGLRFERGEDAALPSFGEPTLPGYFALLELFERMGVIDGESKQELQRMDNSHVDQVRAFAGTAPTEAKLVEAIWQRLRREEYDPSNGSHTLTDPQGTSYEIATRYQTPNAHDLANLPQEERSKILTTPHVLSVSYAYMLPRTDEPVGILKLDLATLFRVQIERELAGKEGQDFVNAYHLILMKLYGLDDYVYRSFFSSAAGAGILEFTPTGARFKATREKPRQLEGSRLSLVIRPEETAETLVLFLRENLHPEAKFADIWHYSNDMAPIATFDVAADQADLAGFAAKVFEQIKGRLGGNFDNAVSWDVGLSDPYELTGEGGVKANERAALHIDWGGTPHGYQLVTQRHAEIVAQILRQYQNNRQPSSGELDGILKISASEDLVSLSLKGKVVFWYRKSDGAAQLESHPNHLVGLRYPYTPDPRDPGSLVLFPEGRRNGYYPHVILKADGSAQWEEGSRLAALAPSAAPFVTAFAANPGLFAPLAVNPHTTGNAFAFVVPALDGKAALLRGDRGQGVFARGTDGVEHRVLSREDVDAALKKSVEERALRRADDSARALDGLVALVRTENQRVGNVVWVLDGLARDGADTHEFVTVLQGLYGVKAFVERLGGNFSVTVLDPAKAPLLALAEKTGFSSSVSGEPGVSTTYIVPDTATPGTTLGTGTGAVAYAHLKQAGEYAEITEFAKTGRFAVIVNLYAARLKEDSAAKLHPQVASRLAALLGSSRAEVEAYVGEAATTELLTKAFLLKSRRFLFSARFLWEELAGWVKRAAAVETSA